jgi:mRNA interferase HigB
LGTFLYFEQKAQLRIIAKKVLREFWEKHPLCEQPLKAWYKEAYRGHWSSPRDIKILYPSASLLPNNRVVFNIKGNQFRLVVRINYDFGMVWIRFIGTHAQYDRIDATTI